MLDNLLEALFDSLDLGPSSRRAQTVWRLLFGLAGAALGSAGVYHALAGTLTGSLHFRLAAAALFASLTAFCLLNVALHRSTPWPRRAFIVSFVGIFAVRILLGP